MEEDDWDNPAPPLSRSDRIQRITSPDSTLQRQRSHPPTTGAHLQHPHPQGFPGPHFHVGSNNSLARSAQAQQLQLAGFHPYDMGLLDPGHVATLRRQAQMLALQAQAAASHSNSLPRSANHQQPLSVPPVVSPSSSHRILNQRYKQSSLPPTAGPLRVASPSSAAQRLESALERGGHGDATLSRRGPYWGQVGPGNYDPYSVGGGGGVYPGDGSTSSYARVGQNNNRQTYPPQHQPLPQTAEPIYNLQHDESTSLTSQKTSRTQTSMLTKSAPTPSGSGVSGGSGAGPLPPKPTEGGSGASGSSMSASAKYAEYLSSLEKYQHPPPSKRHVTFSKYRGRQCTMGMLAVFALLVVGLVVAPVVYFTAFANKTQSSEASTETRLTSFINGQITLDTTHGAYADLITDPARPNKDNDNAGLRRVQRDMEELLKDVLLHGAGGFAADEVSSVMVSQPQRPDTHQIFLRFQVLLKGAMPLDLAEAKTSKAFASATTTDPLGTNLNTVPIIANSLFYRAVPQTNASNAANEQLLQPLTDVDAPPPPYSRPSDAPSEPKRAGVPAHLSTVGNSPATQPTLLMTPPSPPPPASSPPPTTRTTSPTTTRTTPTTTKRTTTTTALMNVNPDDENFSVAGKVPNRKNTRPPQTTQPEAPTFAFTLPPLTTSPITPPPPAPSVFTRPETTQFIKFTPPPQEMFPIRDLGPNMERDRGFTAPADNVSGWPVTRPQGMPLQETPHFTGPQFVQVFDPHAGTTPDMQHNFPNQPEQFSPNMQPSQFGPNIQPAQFGPNMQPSQMGPNNQPAQFGPNMQPAQFSPNFQPPPAPDMNGNRQLGPIDNAFHPLPGPGPIVPFSRFSLDDASAAAASEASVVTTLRTEPTAKTTAATTTRTTTTTTPTTTTLTTTQKAAGEVTRETEERTLAPEKREFSGTADGMNLPSRAGEFVKDGMDFGDSFASTAPLLVSEWGNWSEWGACSAPRCSAEGFQMRTRACMTSINGAVPLADHDASCSVNGGQGIEARPCLCDTAPAVTEMPPEDETYLPDPVPSTVAIVTTARTIPVAWSEWTDWSSCSIAPCHAQGIQTRHRTCRVEGSSGQQVPEEACLSGDGAAVETRVCECTETLQTVTPPAGESEVVTTPTFVRPSSAARESVVQPQRTFSMQVQNRPLQKRPLVSSSNNNSNNLPRTCSFYEKPCNNGQCILSYRVCDGFPDCSDGSDEPLGCGRCFSGEFKCTNGRCISESLVCDGKDNCGDGTDEFFC